MSYRDDRDADQAHIAALEAQLASARSRISELEGRRDQALVLTSRGALDVAGKPRSAAVRWLGAPLVLEMSRTFERAFPAERLDDLVGAIREIAQEPGRAELLRSSLTWYASGAGTSARTTVTVVVRDGKTTLRVSDRLHQLAGAIFG